METMQHESNSKVFKLASEAALGSASKSALSNEKFQAHQDSRLSFNSIVQPSQTDKSFSSRHALNRLDSSLSGNDDGSQSNQLKSNLPKRINSQHSCSAFTPVFRSQQGSGAGKSAARQSEQLNNASKTFWQSNSNQPKINDLALQKSQGSAAPLQESRSGSMASGSLPSVKKQSSDDSKSSGRGPQLDKFTKPLQLLRRGSSQAKSVSERDNRLSTPTSQATLRRNLSIFGGLQGSSLLQNIGLAPINVRLQTPQSIELNSLLQPGSAVGKSPHVINYQRSISGVGGGHQRNLATPSQTPLTGSGQKDFNIPQPKWQFRSSLNSLIGDPFAQVPFLAPQGLSSSRVNVPESPEINLKGQKCLLSGLGAPSQKIEQLLTTNEELQQSSVLKQFFQVGAPQASNHILDNSSLALRHFFHSIQSQSGASETDAQATNKPQFASSNTTGPLDDPILDQYGPSEEKTVKAKQKSVRQSKSGPSRKAIEVVEQESELTKVTYNVEMGDNKRAVYISGLGIIDDYMASDDLNECVDALLQKRSKAAFQQHAAALESAKKTKDTPKSELSDPKKQECHSDKPSSPQANHQTPTKQMMFEGLRANASHLHSTSDNSPEVATSLPRQQAVGESIIRTIPRVVIRHRIKGAKKAQKRLRKNEEQNKILFDEFQKNAHWNKAKIVQLQEQLGLKQSQIYKWNWDMQRKLEQHKGASQSVSAPDISCDDHTGRKVSDWTGDMVGEVDNLMCPNMMRGAAAQSHASRASNDEEDSLMTDEQEGAEAQSQAAPESATLRAEVACE